MTPAPGLAARAARPPVRGLALAIDVATDSVTAALVGGDRTAPLIRRRLVPPAAGAHPVSNERLVQEVDAVVSELRQAAGVTVAELGGVRGIAVSVDVDPAGAERGDGPGTPALDALTATVRDEIVARPDAEVRTVRRAVAVTIGEHWRGAARGRRAVLGIADSSAERGGSGIDGALMLDGRLLGGPGGQAGRIGHVPVDPYGPGCGCGARGCLTAVASSAAVVAWAAAHGRFPATGTEPDLLGAVGRAAARGDPVALASLRRAGEAIGFAAAAAVTLLDLDVVVVSGPLVDTAGTVLFDAVDDGYRRHAGLGQAAAPRVVPGELGPDAAVIGAAAMVLHPERYG